MNELELFKYMFKNSNSPILIFDNNLNIIESNNNACFLFGFKDNNYPKKLFGIISDKNSFNSEELINQIQENEVTNIFLHFKNLEGIDFFAESNIYKYSSSNTCIYYLYIINENIIEDTFENSPIAIAIGLNNGKLEKCNKAFSKLTGYTINELNLLKWNNILIPDKLLKLETILMNQLNPSNKNITLKKEIIRKDGIIVPIEITIKANFNKQNFLTHYYIYIINISEKTQIEKELDESQKLYYSIFTTAQIPIIITNEKGFVVEFNKAANEQIGYTPEEYAKLNMSQVDVTRNTPEEINKIVTEIQTYGYSIFEAKHKHKNGNILDIVVYASFIIHKGQKLNLAIFHDLTEFKRNQTLILKQNEELEQFNYITSHDLQEPLNSIMAYIQLMQIKGYQLDEFGKKTFEVILNSTIRMKELINSLLEYSLIGNEIIKKEINLNEAINNIKIDLYDLISRENATVEYYGPEISLCVIEQDFYKLLENLIINGIKFRKKEILPKIIISLEDNIDEYTFSVSDNGIGIEEANFNKIFEVFKRLNSLKEYYGTGIGLTHCKKIVEKHNGRIWVESSINNGSTFYFTIKK